MHKIVILSIRTCIEI